MIGPEEEQGWSTVKFGKSVEPARWNLTLPAYTGKNDLIPEDFL